MRDLGVDVRNPLLDLLGRQTQDFNKSIFREWNTNWANELETIVNNHKKTQHETLDDHTPNKALKDEEVRIEVLHSNINKSKKNAYLNNDLSVGDHVRVSIANYFKKGTEPRYSDEVYTVEGVKGMNITLNDDKVCKRDKLLKIPKDTIKITKKS